MTSFKEIIQQFVGSTNVGLYMIHLKRATERIKDIDALEHRLQSELFRFDAAEGTTLVEEGHPTKCITGGTRGAGDIGCIVSHIRVCKDALEKGYSHIVIFEDDCEAMTSLERIQHVLTSCKDTLPAWDLFLLDASYIHSQPISQTISKVFHFNETHAVILNQKFMRALVALYESYLANGTTYAIDGIYSNVLKAGTATAYGVQHRSYLFRQKPGLFSYIINGYRQQ